jgi:phosphatidylethanolamine-binding protein (PEBP) family uncharacterized protein
MHRGKYVAPLHWTSAPAGTKSFVVTLFDPDEHGDPSGWWHWIVYNLPASVDKLPKGAGVELRVECRETGREPGGGGEGGPGQFLKDFFTLYWRDTKPAPVTAPVLVFGRRVFC